MESISIYDGLILTIVSMLVVFSVLTAIWGLVELIAHFVPEPETTVGTNNVPSTSKPVATNAQSSDTLAPNSKHQQIAEMMALILASEDEPDRKFEITDSKRVK